ncbi:hypothetical protein T492DRAFT_988956 [Pavlovales sp. CCMP2436]|nr:hypothetical protein T492DRAFT_988956 [Pavlovales sp. CCMP2436]
MAGFHIYTGVAFSPPFPPSPPPNWKPRPPPSPRPPPHPHPPAPPPPPVLAGMVKAGFICGGASSVFGLVGAGLEQPHYPRVDTAEKCAAKLDRRNYPFFAWSASLAWCLGCIRPDVKASHLRADPRYDVYQTAAYHPQGPALGGIDDDPLGYFHQGVAAGAHPFDLHLHHHGHQGGIGLHDLFGIGGDVVEEAAPVALGPARAALAQPTRGAVAQPGSGYSSEWKRAQGAGASALALLVAAAALARLARKRRWQRSAVYRSGPHAGDYL